MKHRACELALCPPTKVIFGREYGVCPLVQECPDNVVCGYAFSRYHVEQERKCQKCGQPTKSEEAWIDGQIWCHPCADLLDQQKQD